ncbi:hypothetical protein [Mucilaginibacter pedocola]|uniref:Uncharacterized protein n=1 Tax=Mucilaginibacter pedocola TaxID=1792845 RepID=A0A1S9PG95_9SPHI|nr:hypothetical protein [Mucilaginibacter pedocola]OOQ59966.1 hypothetical protein BC343_27835 [Mucilaginibacter pedocola]
MKFISLNTAAELICFLAALIFLYRDKSAAWRLFILYMLIVVSTETTAILTRRIIPNQHLYNAFLLAECGFVSYFLYNMFRPFGYTKKWLFAWWGIFAVVYLGELYYFRGGEYPHFVAFTVNIMSVAFVLGCLWFYYVKLVDEQYEPLMTSAQFWWVSGALFFYFGSTACNVFFDYLAEYDHASYYSSTRYVIYNILNIILYSLWTYSIVCRYRQRKLSRS